MHVRYPLLSVFLREHVTANPQSRQELQDAYNELAKLKGMTQITSATMFSRQARALGYELSRVRKGSKVMAALHRPDNTNMPRSAPRPAPNVLPDPHPDRHRSPFIAAIDTLRRARMKHLTPAELQRFKNICEDALAFLEQFPLPHIAVWDEPQTPRSAPKLEPVPTPTPEPVTAPSPMEEATGYTLKQQREANRLARTYGGGNDLPFPDAGFPEPEDYE